MEANKKKFFLEGESPTLSISKRMLHMICDHLNVC